MRPALRLALLIGSPVAALLLGALGASLLVEAAKVSAPEPRNLLQAAAERPGAAVRRIMGGEDPASPVLLDKKLLHWRKGEWVSPFLVAVASGEEDLLRVMLAAGAPFRSPLNDQALCVAAAYGQGGVARLLMREGAPYVRCARRAGGHLPEDIASRAGNRELAQLFRLYRKVGAIAQAKPTG